MFRKIAFCICLVLCFTYIFAMTDCKCKVVPVHSHANECDWGVAYKCTWTYYNAKQVADNVESAEMQVVLPSWLGLAGPESQVMFAASSNDLAGKPLGTLKLTPITGFGSGSILVSKLVVSPDLKKTFEDFLQNVKPEEEIYFEVNLDFDNLNLLYPTDEAFDSFDVQSNLSLNGTPEYEFNFSASLPDLCDSYLSSAIDQIPDAAFANNPEQKRSVLHNKLEAAINAFKAKNANGAYQQIQNDIVPKIQDWVVDPTYRQITSGAFGKVASLLEILKAK